MEEKVFYSLLSTLIVHHKQIKDFELKIQYVLKYIHGLCNDRSGVIPLHQACSNLNFDLMKYFIELGSDISQKNSYGVTPFVATILAHKSSKDRKEDEKTYHQKQIDIIEYLLKKGSTTTIVPCADYKNIGELLKKSKSEHLVPVISKYKDSFPEQQRKEWEEARLKLILS